MLVTTNEHAQPNGKGKWTRQLYVLNASTADCATSVINFLSTIDFTTVNDGQLSRLLSILLRKVIESGNIHLSHYCSALFVCAIALVSDSYVSISPELWDALRKSEWEREEHDLYRNYSGTSRTQNLHKTDTAKEEGKRNEKICAMHFSFPR